MGSEFAPVLFGPILILFAGVLIYLAVSGCHRVVTSKSTLGLGRRRLAFGYLAVLLVCVAFGYWDTIDLSEMKVASGEVTQLQADQYFWGWFVYGFSIMTPFCLFFLTTMGLPALAILRRFRLMSIVGACIGSQVIALLLAFLTLLLFANNWCELNAVRCLVGNYTDIASLAIFMALAFAVASRLPLFRWTEHAS